MSHLKALLNKNWILWKRNWFCSGCEILLPVLFVILIVYLRIEIETADVVERGHIDVVEGVNMPQMLYPNMEGFEQFKNSNMDIDELLEALPTIKNCKSSVDSEGASYRNGDIALGPQNNKLALKLEEYFTQYYGYQVQWFNDNNDIDAYVTNSEYGKSNAYLCLGIMFTTNSNDNHGYTLRFNTSDTTEEIELPSNQLDKIDPLIFEDQETGYLFYESGYLTIQNWIDNLIIQEYNSNIRISPTVTYVRRLPHTRDNFAFYTVGQFGIFLVLPLIIVYLRMTYALIYEKEKKLREGMMMMGLSDSSFYLSWIIQYMIIYTIISILITSILNGLVFPETNWLVLFLNYWLFCMVLIAQSLFIQVFFTRSMSGLVVAIVWYLLKYMVVNLVGSKNVPESRYWAASLSSHAAVSFSFDVITKFEVYGQGVQFDTLDLPVKNYYVGMAFIMHLINIFFYLLLALYLDQVFPNEWGKKKHPLFFIPCLQNRSEQQVILRKQSSKVHQSDDRNEEVEQALKDQEQHNEAVVIKGLNKTYSNGKVAVQDLSLSMYQGQIFALLGHNGAGKTTTISMMTGLLEITQGSATAYGLDVNSQMEELRRIMGVCPQHDILFDNLTVIEHLMMFATFKGMNNEDIPAAVRKIIEDVDLLDKTDYLIKNLSGGQKRRLSVAIAFIGNSKLIYLDEPTSGMDTSARRFIWEMLKNYKEDRIIVLTTHFMDEADFLGDRIGIMGEGKLLCSGSSVFLKNQFGVGYNLTLVKENTNIDSAPIIKLVQSSCQEATVISNVSAEVAFQLPIGAINKFPKLFDELDNNLTKVNVSSYGISITTLEEVFLKVAKLAGHKQVDDIQQQQNEIIDDVDDFDINSIRITDQWLLFKNHTMALMLKRLRITKRDVKGLVCEIFLPCLIVICGLAVMTIKYIKDDDAIEINPSLYSITPQSYWSGDSQGQNLIQQFDGWEFNILNNNIYQADIEYSKTFNNRESPGWYYINSITNVNYNYMFFINTIFVQGPTLLLNQMNQAILRVVSGNPNAQINLQFYPLNQTEAEYTIDDQVSGYIGAFIFSIAMAFIPASIIQFIVKEREINIKHQQLVSGVGVTAYWVSNWLIDVIKHFLPTIICALMVLVFDINSLIKGDNYGALWLFFILYGWAIIPFCYLCSFIFKVPGNALMATFFINLLCGSILSITVYVLKLVKGTRDVANILQWIFRPIPSFAFAYGIINVTNKEFYQKLFSSSTVTPNTFDLEIAGTDILFLALSGVVYFMLVFVVEYFEDNGSFQKLGSGENDIQMIPKQYDTDVTKEAEHCSQLDPSSTAVVVQNLRKVFILGKDQHKVAVDNISFSVANGEVFGLLGVNGAGKTTTFKILSGELQPTSGNAFVAGSSVTQNVAEARRNMGYCPQFDALLDNLTVREHLELFTIIKAIPRDRMQELVGKKMNEMDLKRFEHIEAGQLSGGNKRKLSVAIAMIGNPPIVLLDEPSTGMDPEARRFMWDVISRIATKRKQSSIILTTHSMEEAEALSSKIAIQVDGNLRCFGSVQHVKNKYGQGYELEIKLDKPSQNEISQLLTEMKVQSGQKLNQVETEDILNRLGMSALIEQIKPRGFGSHIYNDLRKNSGLSVETLAEFIQVEQMGGLLIQFIGSKLGNNEIIEHFQTFFRFRLKSQVSAGKLFAEFEQNKSKMRISQYSIKQASIEQIFNKFAQQDLQMDDVKQLALNNDEAIQIGQ